jgi:uncharacterized protein (TIGR03382 family)
VKKLLVPVACALALTAVSAWAQQLPIITQSTQAYQSLPTSAVVASLDADDEGVNFPLGFSFPYMGQTYTHAMVSTNGIIVLGNASSTLCATSGCFTNSTMPNTGTPNATIAGWWDDLDFNDGGEVRVESSGSQFVAEWFQAPRRGTSNATYVTFQIRLSASGSFFVHYGSIVGTSTSWTVTTGFENEAGTQGAYLVSGCTSSCTAANFPAPGTLFVIGEPNEADLAVSGVTIANFNTEVDGNLTFTVNAALRNFGRTEAPNFMWRAFLSRDQQLNVSALPDGGAADVEVASGGPESLPGVDGGVTLDGGLALVNVTASAATTTPPATGEYYVLVEVDPTNVVTEASEANNVGSTPTAFVQGVDLVATSISGPTTTGGGNVENLTVNFFNRGTTPAGTVGFRILFSVDQVLDSGDAVAFTGSRTVSGGQTINEVIPVTIPANAPNGQFYWLLQVNPTNTPVEASTTNNVAASTGKVDVIRSDLVLEAVDLLDPVTDLPTSNARFGDPVRFRLRYRNTGGANANNFRVGLVLSTDSSLSLLSDTYVCDQTITQLTANSGSVTTTLNCALPIRNAAMIDFTSGPYYLYGVVDAAGAVFETNKANNSMIKGPIRIVAPGPDLTVTAISAPASAGVGEIIPLVRTLRNSGNVDSQAVPYRYYASANDIITADDVPLHIIEAGMEKAEGTVTLAKGTSNQATELVRLPGSMPAGTYYVGCIIDPLASVTNDLDPTNNALASRTMVVAPSSLRIVNTSLPDAVVGRPYSFRLSALGEQGASTWRIDPLLGVPPTWLSLSADGLLSGTPPGTDGVSAVGVTVTLENGGRTVVARLAFRVMPSTSALDIVTSSLPAAVNSSTEQYQFRLGAVGGVAPYSWRLAAGTLPTGMALTADGTLFGAPRNAANGNVPVTFEVRDAVGSRASRQLSLRLISPGAITFGTVFIPDALVGQEYLQDIAVKMQDGSALARPLTWRVSGAVPAGLVVTPQTELITVAGRPTESGTFTFTIAVEDANGRGDTLDFTMTVHPPRYRVTTVMPEVVRPGEAVTVALTASPNSTSLSWRVVGGTLPPGLALDATGTLTGTVAEDAPNALHAFLVEVKDTAGMSGITPLSLLVERAPRATGCSAVGGAPMVFGLLALALLRRRRR